MIQLVHAEDLVREEHHSHDNDQQQGHLHLLLVEGLVVHVFLLHPDPLHCGDWGTGRSPEYPATGDLFPQDLGALCAFSLSSARERSKIADGCL